MEDASRDEGALAELRREVEALRLRQKAVADVLHTLSSSGMRLQPILDRIVEAAARLCDADSAQIFRAEGELFHVCAAFGIDPPRLDYERQHPSRADPGSCTGRVVMTRRPVHIADVLADPGYTFPMPEEGGDRTLLGVPVLAEDELVGVIGLARTEVSPLDQGDIDLVATFADQCAVAIVGAELFETVERQKTELARFVSPEVAALVSSEEGAQLLAGHRGYVTVAYFDLRGFTSFVESAEPEELIRVVGEYHAAAGELIRAHGGTLEHFAGDGLMVFFNDPVPMPDHELQAAKLACAMRDRISALASGWRKRGHELALGAGIAAGHATLGRIGFEGRYDYGVLGSVTNLAARLSDAAAPGQILISQRVSAVLDQRVDAKPIADIHLKGFARPTKAYELLHVDASTVI